MRLLFHIVFPRIQFITMTIFQSNIHHTDTHTTNLSMWVITQMFAEWREIGVEDEVDACKKCCTYTRYWVTSRSAGFIDAVLSPYGRMYAHLLADKTDDDTYLCRQVGWDFISVMEKDV